jgi:NADH dehydrogenase
LGEELIRLVLVHPGDFILPELGEELGRYAERKLRDRKVEVMKGARVANYDGVVVTLSDGTSIPARTLIWTAGVKPSPVIASLPYQKERGRLLVNEDMSVAGVSGLWAAGDCAAIPDVKSSPDKFYPPTAQHALREGVTVAKNVEAMILSRPLKPFRYKMMGQLASIGHRTGVAMMFGIKFSGFIAWWFWRSVYLMKLPSLAKKLRVMVSWTLDLFFGREIEQLITLRDIEELAGRVTRIRGQVREAPKSALDTSARAVITKS